MTDQDWQDEQHSIDLLGEEPEEIPSDPIHFKIEYHRAIPKDICGPAYESHRVDSTVIEADNRWKAEQIFHAGTSGKIISIDVVV